MNAEISADEEASPLAPLEPAVEVMPLRFRRCALILLVRHSLILKVLSHSPVFIRLRRLESVDVLRGYTLMAMIFVNHSGSWPAWLPHAAWDGVHVADFVMPCFLFTVGVSIALSILPGAIIASPSRILHKVATRTGTRSCLFVQGQGRRLGHRTGVFVSVFNIHHTL